MDRLGEMEAFVAVVEHGGFTEAGRRLGLSKSAISKHVSALETRLSVRLLNRTTRQVSPTDIGTAYYERARRILSDAAEADDLVSLLQDHPSGLLRVSPPVDFGTRFIAPIIGDFLEACPDVQVELELENRQVDLVAENIDVAIRIGRLEDSSLKARQIATTRMAMVAAPAYLAAAGAPDRIEDLADHRLLHYTGGSTGGIWRLASEDGERSVKAGGRLAANEGAAILAAAERGLGIAHIPSFLYGDALVAGRLVEVLPDRPPRVMGIHTVYPPGQHVQPKLRAFIDFLAAAFRGRGPEGW